MDRSQLRDFYCFIHNGNNTYFSFVDNQLISSVYPNQKPLDMNPSNLREMLLSFGTNKVYFSGVRALLVNWIMIGDGADIVRTIKYNGLGYADELYLLIVRYNPDDGIYYKYYEGRLDLAQCKDTSLGYTVPCIDSSVWGILSQNDDTKYAIDCSSQAVNVVPILFDGVNLKSRYTWQPVNSEFALHNDEGILFDHPINLVQVNADGDSVGIVTKNEHYISVNDNTDRYSTDNYIYKPLKDNTIRLFGQFNYQAKSSRAGEITMQLTLHTSSRYITIGSNYFHIDDDYVYQYITFDTTIVLAPGEWIEFFMGGVSSTHAAGLVDWTILPDVTNIYIQTQTKTDASIVYGRRPLDVLQELVSKATNGQFTANSVFYSANKNKVLTCGNALRNAPNAVIQCSFKDWFKSYDIEDWIAFRIINNQMWIEPVTVVYDDTNNLFDIGEIRDYEIEDAYDYLCNQIELNMNPQDYRHTSGRLEFNGHNTFSVYQFNVKNTISLISPFRKDCYGMEFIRYDYQQQSTQDNSGDSTVFMVEISDQTGSAGAAVGNYVNVEVNNQPLAPIIYYPFNNDVINNTKPTIRGVCQPSATFKVYVDGVLDGSGTSDATPYGNFVYDIKTALSAFVQDVNDGIHLIELTFTDLTGTTSSRNVTIFSAIQPTAFDNIHSGDNLYDNKPLVRGFLETGVSAVFAIDGVTIATVTGDGNCRWSYKVTTPMNKGAHVLTIGSVVAAIDVFSFVENPLITSFEEGFPIVNNLPLVEGVAIPGTKVNLWLDYYPNVSIGTDTADANGNWSVQLVALFKDDTTVLTPIPNGSHIISTDLQIFNTTIGKTGYLLNRPAYDDIQGVLDNTVYNTELTPMHNLIGRMRYWKSIFAQQPNTVIKFETGDKNIEFSTTLNGVTFKENSDVSISDYADSPFFLPYVFSCIVETPFFFADVIDRFNNGGLVRLTYQGLEVFCLPIGKMTVTDVSRDVQKWSLLVSAKTPLLTLLNLSNPGVIFNIMGNSLFRSDYNTLHFVKYGYDAPITFDGQSDIYDDWFMNRNNRWVNEPDYLQKVQNSDTIIDQIVVNSLSGTPTLKMFRAEDGTLYQTYYYQAITPAPIPQPDIVLQSSIYFGAVPEGEYFFTIDAGAGAFAISERISVKQRWNGTILIDAAGSKNKTGTFFSTGWRSKIRVEGLVEKWVGQLENNINEDEMGNFDVLKAVTTKKRTVLFGNGKGIPDYLYLKICNIITLDDLLIQGVGYAISKDAHVEPVDKLAGYPMYYYSVDFDLKDNSSGISFDNIVGRQINNVVLSIDNGAFGIGNSQLSMIELNNEFDTLFPPAKLGVRFWNLGVTVPANYAATVNVAKCINLVVDWGDGTKTTITDINQLTATHTYINAGSYNVSFSGEMDAEGLINPNPFGLNLISTSAIDSDLKYFDSIFLNTGLTKIPLGLFSACPQAKGMSATFYNCKITSIPAGLFDNCPFITTFEDCFKNSVLISSTIPVGLFKNNTEVLSISSIFMGCSKLTGSIPAGLFDSCKKATKANATFYGCVLLTGNIPNGLFANNILITDFGRTFQSCSNLTGLGIDMFKGCVKVTTFLNCFLNCTNLAGKIPDNLFAGCNLIIGDFANMFKGFTKLTEIGSNVFLNCSASTSFVSTFQGCTGITKTGSGVFSGCSAVTTFATTFTGCTALGNIGTDMFKGCSAVTTFINQFLNYTSITSIGATVFSDCSAVASFEGTFQGCSGITTIGNDIFLNCVSVSSYLNTFNGCSKLVTIPDNFLYSALSIRNDKGLIDELALISCTCDSTFRGCTSLKNISPTTFTNVPLVNSFRYTFNGCTSLVTVPAGLFGAVGSRNITNGYTACFQNCNSLTTLPSYLFVNTNAGDLSSMGVVFMGCTSLNNLPANLFTGFTQPASISNLFEGCTALTNLPADLFSSITGKNTSYCNRVFFGCTALVSIPDGLFATIQRSLNYDSCFEGCTGLTSLPPTLFKGVSGVAPYTSFARVFLGCSNITGEIPAKLFDIYASNDCTNMFNGCSKITSIHKDLFLTIAKNEAGSVGGCFQNCIGLTSIPAGLMDNMNATTSVGSMFNGCTGLTAPIPPDLFTLAININTFTNCFLNCVNITGAAPTLWVQFSGKTGTACFRPLTQLTNYASIPANWK